jgi:hypothetical protein
MSITLKERPSRAERPSIVRNSRSVVGFSKTGILLMRSFTPLLAAALLVPCVLAQTPVVPAASVSPETRGAVSP